jgi:2-hydroxychromene-2-carboxylate isomerase
MQQEFKPVAIGGSNSAKAHAIAEDIAATDYHVADMQREHRSEGIPKVRYKDTTSVQSSNWGAAQGAIEMAIAAGRQTRLQYGSGLDVLQANIKSGAEPDLIANSKRRGIRIY